MKYIVSSSSASGVAGSHENQLAKGAGSSVSGSSGLGSGLSGSTTGSSPHEKIKKDNNNSKKNVLADFAVCLYIIFIIVRIGLVVLYSSKLLLLFYVLFTENEFTP